VTIELELTKANRLKVARTFRHNPRVDLSIECVIEGQMGAVFVDALQDPTVYRIVQGPFWYFAGQAGSAAGREMVRDLPAYTLLMPSPSDWIEVAKEVHGANLIEFGRYSFTSDGLAREHLEKLLSRSKFRDALEPIDMGMASQFRGDTEHFVDLSAFDSAEDFAARGVGFCLRIGERVVAAAYSSLVCSKGIEVSIFVEPKHRERGIATALGSKLVLHCLERGLEPHWDAANAESCKLAEKLGYRRSGTYTAYYRGV
jgi:GNAT superfamily N-acetyltransferase